MAGNSTTIATIEQKPAMNSLPMAKVDSVMNDDSSALTGKTTNIVTETTLPTDSNIRVLGLHEYKEAALSLALAFEHDDVSRYFLDTPDRAHWTKQQKWDLHLKIMEYITYAHLLKGLVLSVGPNYDCVALWMPPGKNIDDLPTIFRSGLWRLNYLLSHEGRKRFFSEFFPLLHDTKAAVLEDRDPSSWYLVYIGTKPEGRGKGYARKVVDFVAEKADREGRACYLESSNVVNEAIYRKMGFEVSRRIYLQRAKEGKGAAEVKAAGREEWR
ncbi:uncharacterized protein LTR77_009190 [Saxophila tyrrhenica]|uniref:N-acetyltransferase domain-containing protein n=1 Tax=Saxophila tyrrhenica TaxID=1690608 RepID=A0AAV9P2H6_9PEZI|nr:hypothetical protein LTR77_009190 [Saxophila tyrrhenica]